LDELQLFRRAELDSSKAKHWEASMGLLDILNGMQNGPRGQGTPAAFQQGGLSDVVQYLIDAIKFEQMAEEAGMKR
jgi:hypothetical protein